MPRYTSPDGSQVIDTDIAREGVQLRGQGYTVTDVPTFDPDEHTVDEVEQHLTGAPPEEVERVVAAERSGKARKTVLSATAGDPSTAGDQSA